VKCVIDQKRETDRLQVCPPCRQGLADDLRALVDAYAMLVVGEALEPADIRVVVEDDGTFDSPTIRDALGLHAGPVRQQAGGAPVSGSREAPIPINLDPVDLTLRAGPSSIYDPTGQGWRDQIGQVPVATMLDSWVRDWISYAWCPADHLPVPTVVTLVGWLDKRLEAACDQHPAIDDFAREIRATLHACQRAAGEASDLKKLGHCPEILDNGSTCGQMLYVHPYADLIECRRCGRRWDRRKQEWLWLGQLLGYDQEVA